MLTFIFIIMHVEGNALGRSSSQSGSKQLQSRLNEPSVSKGRRNLTTTQTKTSGPPQATQFTPIKYIRPKATQHNLQERLQVAVRVRPLHPSSELGHEHVITTFDRQISVKSGIHHDLKTSFDRIMDESTQEQVFADIVRPIIPQFLNGYNCTVFTYG